MTKTKSLKEKNILYITHSYNNFVKFQVEILAEQFNHVYVLMRHKPITAVSKIIKIQEIAFHSLDYKIDPTNMPKNITVIPTPIWYVPLQWFYKRLGPWHAKAVLKAIKNYDIKFDMIHAHFLWSAGYAGMEVSKQYNVPLVVTGHGQDVYKQPFLDKERRKGITDVLKYAHEVITVSKNNLRIIEDLGIKRKVHVIPNGFLPDLYKRQNKKELRKELGLPLKKKIFVTVANLEKVKGHEYLLQSIKTLVKDHKDIYFVWVGGGLLYTKLLIEIRKLGLEDHILMTNFQSHLNVVKYELASDYFVLPSLNEGVPTVMFESLACGIPFISTHVGGIPEINRKFSGIIVEPKNSEQLAQAIEKALKTKWNSKKIIEYSKEYTWEKICQKIESIYENLC